MWGIVVIISSVAELGLLAVLLALPGTPSATRLVCPSFSAASSKQFSGAMCLLSKKACSAWNAQRLEPVGYFQFIWDFWAVQA